MTAYYNEIDPFAAEWLRSLIAAGHIAPGDVDERSIEDVRPDELAGYTQCHFFAGIGGWSLALRMAGWPDEKPVWTGSCPCQPFSAAGKGTGFYDERHLWPSFQWLIQQCQPPAVFGEQVASKATGVWFDLVQADMEAMGYAFGLAAFPAAGVGAPHIRDRAFWVGHRVGSGLEGYFWNGHGETGRAQQAGSVAETGGAGWVADSDGRQRDGQPVIQRAEPGWQDAGRAEGIGEPEPCGDVCGLADSERQQCEERLPRPGQSDCAQGSWSSVEPTGLCLSGSRPSPTNGHWRAADWLHCRDGKWRPVEPGIKPLVDGLPRGVVPSSYQGMAIDANRSAEGRVMRLRGYGNAIVPQAAAEFIIATQPHTSKRHP